MHDHLSCYMLELCFFSATHLHSYLCTAVAGVCSTSSVMTTWQQYELVCTIGKGKYGTVARARHKILGLLVALKSVLNMHTELAIPTGTLSSSSSSSSSASSSSSGSCDSSSSETTSSSDRPIAISPSERGNGSAGRGRGSGNSSNGSLSKERRSLYHEARVLATLSHPCLVSLVEICVDSRGELVLALEDLGGMSLSGLVRQRKRQQERSGRGDGLCDCLVGCVANHVARGLRYLHSRGYLHRDVKPDNIMVESTARNCFPHAKLIDLGLSIAYTEHDLPNTSNSRAGTLAYMAPELMLPNTLYGPKIDLFGLGACMYYALLGEEPFMTFTTKNGVRSTTSIFGLQFHHEDGLDSLRPEMKDMLLASLHTRPDDRCSVQQLLRTPWLQTCAVADSFVRHARMALPKLASSLQLQHNIPSTLLRCLHSDCLSAPLHLTCSRSSSSGNTGMDSLDEVSSIRDSSESSVGEQSCSDSVFVSEVNGSNVLSASLAPGQGEKLDASASTSILQQSRAPSVDCSNRNEPATESNNGQSITGSCSGSSNTWSKSNTKSTDLIPSGVSVPSSSSSSESVCRVLGLKDASCRSRSLTSSCSCPDGSSSVPRETDTVEAVARLLQLDTDTVLRSLECQPWGQTAGVYNLLNMEKRYIKFSPPVNDQECDCCGVDKAVKEADCCGDASKNMMNKTL